MQHPKEGHDGASQEVKHQHFQKIQLLEEWNSVHDLH